jgi:8-oxo-dGTP pyrophosphatase MutT (NUDIX family)
MSSNPKPSSATKSSSRAEPTSRPTSEGRPKPTSERRTKPTSESKTKPTSEREPKSGSESKPQSNPGSRPKAQRRSKPRSRVRAKPEGQPEPGPKPRRRRRAPAREISAGGVVVRGEDVVVIVPTRRASDGSRVLGLPKGHVDPGETAVQAAEREVREETGIVAEAVRELGEARYWYRRNGRTIGKSVSFYLFNYLGGDTADHDDEVEEVRWIALKKAQTELTHEAEREMVGLAVACLDEGAPKDR